MVVTFDQQPHAGARLPVTLDARALDGTRAGTQVHVLELARALARSGRLSLRLLVRGEAIDGETLALLRALPGTTILDAREISPDTPASTVFHRPLQSFTHDDVAIACDLGERIVLSQLDLIAYSTPDYFPDARAFEEYRRASRHGMAAAERVLVFSEHTRAELQKAGLVEEERIVVVPPGLDHCPAANPRPPAGVVTPPVDVAPPAGSSTGHEAGEDFLLCLGADYAHKNRPFALRLLAALRAEHGWRGRLILAGAHVGHGSTRAAERELLDGDPDLRAHVSDLGPVAEDEKAWLMAHAAAILYPSAYEGFGLVPFECALQGVPCLFAPCSALAEEPIARAATLVPWEVDASATAAHTLLADREARARHLETLARAAAGLTWERAARATIAAYEAAARAPLRVAATLSRDTAALDRSARRRERELRAAHQIDVDKLIAERQLVLADYEQLRAEVGPARALIGAHGALPEDLQRGLLALSARPALSRPLYGAAEWCFRAARAVGRVLRRQ